MEKLIAEAINKRGLGEIEGAVEEVNILHISDLHFGVGKNAYKMKLYQEQRKEMIDKLILQLCTYENDIGRWKPDIVVVSGDLAFRGKSCEYKQYKEDFYKVIKDGFAIDDDCIVVCPGNHDIIRKNTIASKTASGKDILYPRPKSRGENVGDELEDLRKINEENVCREQIGENLNKPRAKHFHDYIVECCDRKPQKLVYLHIPNKWQWVHFAVLNSAWDCRDNEDEGKLRVGLDFINETLQKSKAIGPKDSILCAVFHHPHMPIDVDNGHGGRKICNWLTVSEQNPVIKGGDCFVNRINNSVKCIMNGHVHEEKVPTYLGNDVQMVFWSICGTLLSDDTSTYHCRVIKIRRGGSLSHLDLSNTAGNTTGDWNISFHPGNRVDKELLVREAVTQAKREIIQREIIQASHNSSLNTKEKLQIIARVVSRIVPFAISNSELISILIDYFLKENQLHENNDVYTLRRRRKDQ